MQLLSTPIALALSVLLCVACAKPAARPTHLPAFPEALADPHPPAWAAFELALDVDGRVAPDRVRLVGWEAAGADAPLYVALWVVASGTVWDPTHGRKAPRRVTLVLDGTGQPLLGPALRGVIQAQVDESIRVRSRAFAALTNGSTSASGSGPVSEHDLDCAWMGVAGLRSGAPFLHDDVSGWSEIKPSLVAAEQASGGLWVCRVPRRTHSGQFVFLDADRAVLGIRRYILGE